MSQVRSIDLDVPETWSVNRLTFVGEETFPLEEAFPRIWAGITDLMGGAPRIETRHIGDYLAINLDRADDGLRAGPLHWDDPDHRATLDDQRLGLVVLALLTKVAPGEGGTVLAPGSLGPTARLLAAHPDGVDLDDERVRREIGARCDERVEATGDVGETYLVHPFVLHARGVSNAPILRVLSNPNIFFTAPMELSPAGAGRSLVEHAVRRVLYGERTPSLAAEPAPEAIANAIVEDVTEGRFVDALERAPALLDAPEDPARRLAETLLNALRGDAVAARESALRLAATRRNPERILEALASALDQPALAAPAAVAPAAPRRARLAWVRRMAARGRWEEARDVALSLARDFLSSADELAELAWTLEEHDVGEVLLETRRRLVEIAPDDASAVRALARLHLFRVETREARAYAERLAALAPDDPAGPRIEGAAALLEGDVEAALLSLDRALALAPRDQETLVWVAESERARGRLDAALARIERALEIGPHGFAVAVLYALLEAELEVASLSKLERPGGRVDFEMHYESLMGSHLRRWIPEEEEERVVTSTPARRELLRRVLVDLGGNRTPRPTVVAERDGRRVLERVDHEPSPRGQADAALGALPREGAARVRATLDALVERFEASPHPRCFRGELSLWQGDHERAREDFERALEVRETRWAWIGLGAIAMLEGAWEESSSAFARADAFGPVEGATTHAYRGELLRRRGDEHGARRELTTAVRARPRRVGAWLDLALLEDAAGDVSAADAALAHVRALAPVLLAMAAEREGERAPRTMGDPGAARVLERCLAQMRGNRSSTIVTFVEDGRLHVPPHPERARRLARLLGEEEPDVATDDDPEVDRLEQELSWIIARTRDVPVELADGGLRLLAVQARGERIHLVLGREGPLARVQIWRSEREGPFALRHRVVPIEPLSPEVRRILGRMGARVARATDERRWRAASRVVAALDELGSRSTKRGTVAARYLDDAPGAP